MKNRKLIIIDKETDEKLGAVCTAALKSSGIEILPDINALINSILEEFGDFGEDNNSIDFNDD
jgi:hypothetical protein